MKRYAVDRKAWAERELLDQLGNIGSEVGRAIASHGRADADRTANAIDRALDLFDATAESLAERHQLQRLQELLRSREVFLGLFYDNRFDKDAEQLERYFMQFAMAERNMRSRPHK